jgi:hypothetical protein
MFVLRSAEPLPIDAGPGLALGNQPKRLDITLQL